MPLVRQGPTKIAGVEVVVGGRELTELEKVRVEKKRLKRELIDLYNRDPVWSGPLKVSKVSKVTFSNHTTSKRRYIAHEIISPGVKLDSTFDAHAWGLVPAFHEAGCD